MRVGASTRAPEPPTYKLVSRRAPPHTSHTQFPCDPPRSAVHPPNFIPPPHIPSNSSGFRVRASSVACPCLSVITSVDSMPAASKIGLVLRSQMTRPFRLPLTGFTTTRKLRERRCEAVAIDGQRWPAADRTSRYSPPPRLKLGLAEQLVAHPFGNRLGLQREILCPEPTPWPTAGAAASATASPIAVVES